MNSETKRFLRMLIEDISAAAEDAFDFEQFATTVYEDSEKWKKELHSIELEDRERNCR